MSSLQFKFVEFEVNMVYGFKTKPILTENFNKLIERKRSSKEGKHLLRNGWSTFYKMTSGNNDIIQDFQIGNEEKYSLSLLNKSDFPKWNIANRRIETTITKFLSVRQDGIGTITLKYKFSKFNKLYNTSDVLRALMIVPRTSHCNNDEFTKIEYSISKPLNIPKIYWDTFSTGYQIYLKTLCNIHTQIEELPEWKPLFNGIKIDDNYNQKDDFFDSKNGFSEELSFNGDSQIPYIYVFAKLPYDDYKESFWEDDPTNIAQKQHHRIKYTKEISAILGRWLNSNNIPYSSVEYWQSQNTISDLVFKTQFMNSTVFTVFSGMVALTLYPDLSKIRSMNAQKLLSTPIKITQETVLRFFEYSRLRWHCSITANYGLDIIIKSIANNEKREELLRAKNHLIDIEEKIAINFENPTHFLLDSSLGSTLNNFFNQNILNKTEEEVSRKLNHTRNLLLDRWEYLDSRDYYTKFLTEKNSK